MNDLAVRPSAGFISRAAGTAGMVFSPTVPKYKKSDFYSYWTSAYTKFFWIRLGILMLMLGLPVAFVGLTVFSLLGYGALLAVPILAGSTKKNLSSNWTNRQAYVWYVQLDQAWKEHAEIFYRQIWNHDCDGEKHDHSYYRCESGKSCSKMSECLYCSKRLDEIRALLASKKSLEDKSTSDTDKIIFEASEQFRKAIADQSKPNELMKAISEGVK